MFQALTLLARRAVVERLTLWVNHVLGAEPVATERLRRHAGARLRVRLAGWPALLPAVPPLLFTLTPAGLLDWHGPDDADAGAPAGGEPGWLEVTVDASNPALLMLRQLSGVRPHVGIAGDAALAADISWVIDNVRWDVEDDLARVVGDRAAHQLAAAGGAVAAALRAGLAPLGRAMEGLGVAAPAGGASPGTSDPPR